MPKQNLRRAHFDVDAPGGHRDRLLTRRHHCTSLPKTNPRTPSKVAVAGLFAGIGGFERAFSLADFETNILVEIDPAARSVLRTRFPDVEIRSDVSDLSSLPSNTTIVTAGFPCQNLSMAGDKSGISGSKSGVIEKLFDLVSSTDDLTIVIENVYFMLQLDSGRAMEWLVSRFEHLGYRWAYRVLDTFGFGLPQRRKRVYMLASRHIDPRRILFSDNKPFAAPLVPCLKYPLGFYWTEGRSGIGLTANGIPPLKVGSAIGIPSPPAVLFPDGEVLTPSLRVCEALQGFPQGWTDVPSTTSERNPAWRLVGNAVSIPIAQWVAERIKTPGAVLDYSVSKFQPGDRWPQAAWNVGYGRMGVDANDKPLGMPSPSISAFRDDSWSRLSNRALDGFIRRAEQGGLRMPEHFLDTLRIAKRKAL